MMQIKKTIKKMVALLFYKKELRKKELAQLKKQLEMLKHLKSLTVKEHNFEAAVWYRDKEKILGEKIQAIEKKLK